MTGPIIDGGNATSSYTPTPAVDATGAVWAPQVPAYAQRTPYLTATEFTEAGTGVDVSQLVPDGTQADQTAALLRTIRQASAWADSLCYKILAATVDVQAGLYRPDAWGNLRVPVKYTPLLAVTAVSVGNTGYDAAPLADLSTVWIDGRVVHIDSAPIPPFCGSSGRRRFVVLSYVNGWTNTTLDTSAAAGTSSLSLASNLGVYPGLPLTVDDGATTEQVVVDASFVPGSTGPVPLTLPLANTHLAGAAATALPPDIKRAVISLTSCLIKTRGSEAVVMGSMTAEPSKTALSESGGIEDFELASDLLEQYRRAR